MGRYCKRGSLLAIRCPLVRLLALTLRLDPPDTNVELAIGFVVMMYPMMSEVQYENLRLMLSTRVVWIQLGFSIIVNWVNIALLGMATANALPRSI